MSHLLRVAEPPGQRPELLVATRERRLRLDEALSAELPDHARVARVRGPPPPEGERVLERIARPLPAGLARFGRVTEQLQPDGDEGRGDAEDLVQGAGRLRARRDEQAGAEPLVHRGELRERDGPIGLLHGQRSGEFRGQRVDRLVQRRHARRRRRAVLDRGAGGGLVPARLAREHAHAQAELDL
jgi:hypothetical protein